MSLIDKLKQPKGLVGKLRNLGQHFADAPAGLVQGVKEGVGMLGELNAGFKERRLKKIEQSMQEEMGGTLDPQQARAQAEDFLKGEEMLLGTIMGSMDAGVNVAKGAVGGLKKIAEEIKGLRPGAVKIGSTGMFKGDEWVDMANVVARERFDFSRLKKVSFGGSDRDVYEVGGNKVVKVAKSARGLAQNAMADWYAASEGLIPEIKEIGRNYTIFEKVDPPDPNVKSMIKKMKEVGQPIKLFRSNADRDTYYKEVDSIIGIMEDHGYPGERLRDYGDVLWGDFLSVRNWGVKDGSPVMLDEGSLNGKFVEEFAEKAKQGFTNLSDPEFNEIYQLSKEIRKKFGDLDSKTMYGILGPMILLEYELRQGNTGGTPQGGAIGQPSQQPGLGRGQASPQRLDTRSLQHLGDRGTRPGLANAGSRFQAAGGQLGAGVDRPN